MNADAIDQLLDVIRDCVPLLEQLRDTCADANAVDLDALIAAAVAQLLYFHADLGRRRGACQNPYAW